MSTIWSEKIQSSEVLYYSREERFNHENKDYWFNLLQVKDGMRVLEIGCGGGHFLNMIKRYFPNCEVVGVDIDENHIKLAREKAGKKGIDVKYMVEDISALPFEDESFDLVFSHTVIEHVPFDEFITEQKRVLKRGGKIVIMKVDKVGKKDNPYTLNLDEIEEIYSKLEIEDRPKVGQYYVEPHVTLHALDKCGFGEIDLKWHKIIYYMPDIEQDKKVAENQIMRHSKSELYNAMFVLNTAKNGSMYYSRLLNLIKKQHEKRLAMLHNGAKIYDYESTNLVVISATKL